VLDPVQYNRILERVAFDADGLGAGDGHGQGADHLRAGAPLSAAVRAARDVSGLIVAELFAEAGAESMADDTRWRHEFFARNAGVVAFCLAVGPECGGDPAYWPMVEGALPGEAVALPAAAGAMLVTERWALDELAAFVRAAPAGERTDRLVSFFHALRTALRRRYEGGRKAPEALGEASAASLAHVDAVFQEFVRELFADIGWSPSTERCASG